MMTETPARPSLVIGSPEHKELLCSFFTKTHDPYKPADLRWPELGADVIARLKALPIWEEAVRTEAETALAVLTLGAAEKDPILSKAITLQGYEEQRHAEILALLTKTYGIPVSPFKPVAPADPNWAFMRIGYGECFDSFFAFGLFALARDSGFFPPSLVELFEPIMQEEGRHIIFHVNWVAYNQARLPYAGRPGYVFKRGLAMWLQAVSRLKTALRLKGEAESGQDNFTMNAHEQFGDISPREFVELCIRENAKRLAPYD
ncbi:MAG: ferritin-like domain-containing protein, partial [Elusimicrobiota bacterium]